MTTADADRAAEGDTDGEADADNGGGKTLSRVLRLHDIVLFGIGGIVGAGIYAIIGEAAGAAGNLLWVSFLLAAFVAFLTALTYAELVSRHPDAGGSFEYVKQAFGLRFATITSIFMLFTGVVAAAAIAISFSSYLARLVDLPVTLTTVAIIALMGTVNAIGAAQASWFNTLATVVTLAGLGAVVVVSFDDIGSVDLFDAASADLLGIGIGSALVFFSFIGFEDLVKLSEETVDPRRTMPRGLLISAAAVVVVYLLVAVAAVSALGPDELAGSDGPLAELMSSQAGDAWATAIVAVALFATSKTILSNLLGSSRLVYDVARDNEIGWLARLSTVHERTGTPIAAIGGVTALAIGFGLIGNLRTVAAVSNILIMIVFLLVNASLVKIRRTGAGPDGEVVDDPPFRIPVAVADVPVTVVVAIATTLGMLALNVAALLDVG